MDDSAAVIGSVGGLPSVHMSDTHISQHFETLAIHAGNTADPLTGAVVPPIYQVSTYKQDGVGGLRGGYEYSRSANPTRTALEENLAALEGGRRGLAFASGLAAEDCLLRTLLAPGDHVVIPNDAYGGTFRLFAKVVARWGVEWSVADTSDPAAVRAALTPKRTLASSMLGVGSTVPLPKGAPLLEASPPSPGVRRPDAPARTAWRRGTRRRRRSARPGTGAVLIHPSKDHPDLDPAPAPVGPDILVHCPEVRPDIGARRRRRRPDHRRYAVSAKALRRTYGPSGCRRGGRARIDPRWAARDPLSVRDPATMADGIKVGRPGDVPFGIVGELVDEVRTVTEGELSAALLLCLERAKLVVEPAGASSVAALLSRPDSFEGPVVAVLSGGNVRPGADGAGAAARDGGAGPLPGRTAASDGPPGSPRGASRGIVGGRR
ncbi:O-succinylhomoserine sulfhydrylase [Streptomyces hirsutus]